MIIIVDGRRLIVGLPKLGTMIHQPISTIRLVPILRVLTIGLQQSTEVSLVFGCSFDGELPKKRSTVYLHCTALIGACQHVCKLLSNALGGSLESNGWLSWHHVLLPNGDFNFQEALSVLQLWPWHIYIFKNVSKVYIYNVHTRKKSFLHCYMYI